MSDPTIPVADLLVELGCEELPPKSLQRLAQSFYDGVCSGLRDAGLEIDPGAGKVFYTPRRLGFRIPGVAEKQPDLTLERRGPAVSAAFDMDGRPTQAALGFARSVGMAVDALDRQKTDKGEWLFCKVEKPGQALSELLFPVMEKALNALPVTRPMRWSDHEFSFVRPVHWLLVLHGAEVMPGVLYGQSAGNLSQGHRIHGPGSVTVSSSDGYEETLRSAFVIVDPEVRRERIREMAVNSGAGLGCHTRMTESLLDEVCNIVEWPTAVACRFDEEFLEVPAEALIASMEDHQKFFPVLSSQEGELTAHFVVIANIESTDPGSMQSGFERVIRPRLADARFFWEQDCKRPLEAYTAGLSEVVFQKKLGSVGDKSKRIVTITQKLAELTGQDLSLARRAALLCKADLLTQMVGEFPELQGTMGAHYARVSEEANEVCNAIGEHYSPRFAGDDIPASPLGRLVAIADRLDSLVGIFSAGLKPSGNKDPFALRRAALGTVRILTEAQIDVALDDLLDIASDALSGQIEVSSGCVTEVRNFMLERLRQYYLDHGFDTNTVNGAFAAPVSDLPDLAARLGALAEFMSLDVSKRLIAANKRIGNILRKANEDISTKIDGNRLVLTEERRLFDDVSGLEVRLAPLLDQGNYKAVLKALAGLDDAIDSFFDHVMVMDENREIRANRLALLAKLKGMFDQVADLSRAA